MGWDCLKILCRTWINLLKNVLIGSTKSQITSTKLQMARQAHHPEPGRRVNSNFEISMTETMFGSLEIGAWELFVICLLVLGIFSL